MSTTRIYHLGARRIRVTDHRIYQWDGTRYRELLGMEYERVAAELRRRQSPPGDILAS